MTYSKQQARHNLIEAIRKIDEYFAEIIAIDRATKGKSIAELYAAAKTEGAYNRHLWEACLDLFRGDSDAFGFVDSFVENISEQMRRAWNEGARSVGVEPEDMTDEDLDYLQAIIDSENEFVLGLGEAVEEARDSGMTLDQFRQQFRARVDVWSNRYKDTANEAKLYFGGKERLEWRLGATEQHCTTCARLNGIVAYAEEWAESGLQPQSPPNDLLECGGWRCDCSLEPTDRRRSRDALGTLLDIAVSGNV
jgi:hypothetical protein